MTRVAACLRRWLGREDGSATIEVCIWFPFLMALFGSAFEASILTTRQALLAGAVDRTVRDLQLGNLGNPTHAQLKLHLCNLSGFIPNCASRLHVEMERISTDDFTFRTGAVQCVDVDEGIEPALNFTNGQSNDLMLITVCAAFSPMVPITGLGLRLPKINDGNYYGLVAFSAYVVEPV